MAKKERLTKRQKAKLLKDTGYVDLAAELLNAAIQSVYGDDAGAKPDDTGYKVCIHGVEDLTFIRETFGGMKVVAGGERRKTRRPQPVRAWGDVEALRETIEDEIFETIRCANEDWVVISLRQPRCESQFLEIAVSTGAGSPEFVQDWIDIINLLFEAGKVLS